MSGASYPGGSRSPGASLGIVYLVGSGPGDPGLFTVRGAELLATCDVVVYDRLAPPELLDLAPAMAERIDVGKRPRIDEVDQETINALLVDHARRGRMVVRLKGGDPFVFGRGGEEASALVAAGIPFEVVPGVSAAVAVPAYAGIPVTRRGFSESVTVVTGHGEAGFPGVAWEKVASLGGTLVILMGVTHRAEIAGKLIDGGRSPATPVAVVRWGTRPSQQTVRTTLAGLAGVAVRPPATIVIGEVAGMDLSWFESKPLFGWTVVVTRARAQAPAMSSTLRRAGAMAIELPVIEIAGPGDGGVGLASAVEHIGSYEWLVLTSANGARRLLDALYASGRDVRALGRTAVAAIGPGTAAALAERGVVADLVPAEYVAEALLASFPEAVRAGSSRLLLARAAVARDVLPAGLEKLGWQVDVVEAYRTVRPEANPAMLDSLCAADAVCFTASSTVDGFVEIAGTGRVPPVVACIGPITASTARDRGIAVDVEATEHTIGGLVRALEEFAAAKAGPPGH